MNPEEAHARRTEMERASPIVDETMMPPNNVEKLPDGHRLWSKQGANRPEQFFVLDDSGDHPEAATDGPLHLDVSHPLYMASDLLAIPLVNAAGEPTSTPSDAATILQLAVRFGWPISDGLGHRYAVAGLGADVSLALWGSR